MRVSENGKKSPTTGSDISNCPVVLALPHVRVVEDRLSLKWRVREKDNKYRWRTTCSVSTRHDLFGYLAKRRVLDIATRHKLHGLPLWIGARQ